MRPVEVDVGPQLATLAAAGLIAGLALLARGFLGYRTATRVADVATSPIATVPAGEVRLTGIIEPAEALLVSALQSVPCVYYRASVRQTDDDHDDEVLAEERAIGFRVRDASGEIRVFPRHARWDVPPRYEDRSSAVEGEPTGLRVRVGPAYTAARPDRDAQIAGLLDPDGTRAPITPSFMRSGSGQRRYAEARIEPGDTVTVLGRAIPFSQLSDPAEADMARTDTLAGDDPEVAANIAEAREAGLLLADPEEAWGNAAIPGFGICQPVREPELDPDADRPALAAPERAADVSRTFDIAPDQLVVASGPPFGLLIAAGDPSTVTGRNQTAFVLGLLGAVLAIGSAIVIGLFLGRSVVP